MKITFTGRRTIDGMCRTLFFMMNDRILRSDATEMILSKLGDFNHLKGISSNSITYTYDLNSDKNSYEYEDYDKFIDLDLPERVTWKYFRNALSDPYVAKDGDINYTRYSPDLITGYDIHMEQARASFKKRKRNGKIFKQKSR